MTVLEQRSEDMTEATPCIFVTTPGRPGTNYFAGQRVEIAGVIARPPPPLADGLFDFQSYLAMRGIYYQLKTESANDWQLLAPIPTGRLAMKTAPLSSPTGRMASPWSLATLKPPCSRPRAA